MLKSLKNKKKKGFTLIELIIVIAIIAILAAVAIPKFSSISKDAKVKSDIANAKTISNAVSALIAEGDVEVPSEEITIGEDSTNVVVEYLQNVPVPKSVDAKSFTVTISDNGDIVVKAGSQQFFPEYKEEAKK